eukprot:14664814-Alexandrium_andersonii.AAC.1
MCIRDSGQRAWNLFPDEKVVPVLMRHESVGPRPGAEDMDSPTGGEGTIDKGDGALTPPCHSLEGECVHVLARSREGGHPLVK